MTDMPEVLERPGNRVFAGPLALGIQEWTMPQPDLLAALHRAADHRADVRKFDIRPDGRWSAVTYEGQHLQGGFSLEDLDGGATMEDLLETVLGEEPASRSRRADRWYVSRDKAMGVKVSDCFLRPEDTRGTE